MGKTEEALQKIVKEGDSIFPDNEQLESFENALNEYHSLISLGITKPRGYTLQTIEEYYMIGNSLSVRDHK